MHRVIILAGGGPRKGWTLEHPKVMAKVEGKPIVLRVVLQVKNRGYVPIVLTKFPQVVEAVGGECACYWPPPWVNLDNLSEWYYERPVGGLLDSIPIWNLGGRTTLLCGDTAYPPEALDKILADDSPISFWGNCDEIFAITFLPEQAERLTKAIDESLRTDKTIAHLWTTYRALCGFPLRAHRFEDVIWKELGRKTYLFDFDSVEKYEKWLENNQWAQKE